MTFFSICWRSVSRTVHLDDKKKTSAIYTCPGLEESRLFYEKVNRNELDHSPIFKCLKDFISKMPINSMGLCNHLQIIPIMVKLTLLLNAILSKIRESE